MKNTITYAFRLLIVNTCNGLKRPRLHLNLEDVHNTFLLKVEEIKSHLTRTRSTRTSAQAAYFEYDMVENMAKLMEDGEPTRGSRAVAPYRCCQLNSFTQQGEAAGCGGRGGQRRSCGVDAGLAKCSRCDGVKYCLTEYQKIDFREHKLICRAKKW